MSLRALVQDLVGVAFTALDDVPEAVTYSRKSSTSVNPTTGAVTQAQVSYAVEMVFVNYRREEIDGDAIRPEDMKGLLPAKDLGFVPTLNDTITRGSAVYSVVRIALDPVSSLYTLQVRRP